MTHHLRATLKFFVDHTVFCQFPHITDDVVLTVAWRILQACKVHLVFHIVGQRLVDVV